MIEDGKQLEAFKELAKGFNPRRKKQPAKS